MSNSSDDELILIEDDQLIDTPVRKEKNWRILIVDDDKDVHEATEFALSGMEIQGRSLRLFHVYSGREAIDFLDRETDIAVILLDVVMESDDAGLKTVDAIRNELMLLNTRIILRTGQPGQAPEAETITRYDINDYKTKSELTQSRLFTTLTSAVRCYDQLERLDASRRGLEKIVASSHQFMAEQGLQSFAEGVITQLASLIGVAPEGLVCAATDKNIGPGGYRVIAAAGNYRHLIQHRLSEIDNQHLARSLGHALRNRHSTITKQDVTLYFRKTPDEGFAAFIETADPISEVDQNLLEIFCTNIALCANNIDLVGDLRRDSQIDRQVDLPNRNALIAELDRRLATAAADDVLALIDIDQFAAANDLLGHQYGDAMLKAAALRLRTLFPANVFVARVAGDTFAVTGASLLVKADTIQRIFAQPFAIESVDHLVTVGIGLTPVASNGRGADTLENAYIALRRAKAAGSSQTVSFSKSIGEETRGRTQLLRDLREALERKQIHAVYQPQIDLCSGKIIGIEALMRWQHHDGQTIPPDRFIPVAEQSGLIVPLGQWIMHEALFALQRFRAAGFPELRMAVNISTVQLRQPGFVDFIDTALRETGTSPHNLELEITESVVLEGIEPMIALLTDLRSRGICIAIDDFGTGYSSLNYLEQLPIDHLKIDRSFVVSLASSERGARIVRTISKLGQELNMKTVAEGVEDQNIGDLLQEIGCHAAQGYHYARPMDEAAFLVWLKEHLCS